MGTGKPSRANESEVENQAIEKRRRQARPLAKWMADEPRPIEELLPLMVSVLEAIAAANATEARFCSLNPSKILVREDQSVKLATREPRELGKTFDLGSAKYTYPEFFGEAAPGTPAGANVYIAGFIFYELMLGRKMFDAQFKDVEESSNLGWLTWHADLTKRAISLNEMNRYPSFICRIVDRMIEKDLTNRLTDVNGIARLFASVSNATVVYQVARDSSQVPASSKIVTLTSNEPRQWLANLGRQKFWTSLWQHVAPNEPQLRQRSIEELERMFRVTEATFRKLLSIFSFQPVSRTKDS
jgi:serine/threonine protein kinase